MAVANKRLSNTKTKAMIILTVGFSLGFIATNPAKAEDFEIGFYYTYSAPGDNFQWDYALMDMARNGSSIVQALGTTMSNENFFLSAKNWGIKVVPYHGYGVSEPLDINETIAIITARRDAYDSLMAGDNVIGYMVRDEPEDDDGMTEEEQNRFRTYVDLIHQYDPNRQVYVNHSDPPWYDLHEDQTWCTTMPVLEENNYRIHERTAHAVNEMGFDGFTMTGHAKRFSDWIGRSCGSLNYYGLLGEDCDCSKNMDISFTLNADDISPGGDTYVCFWPKPGYCGETCYIGEKASLFYQPAAPNDPNNLDLTDELLMVNGDTEANDLINLTAHDARYWTSSWMAAYEDACDLNAQWQRTTSPWHMRYGTAGVGIRESGADCGASFKLDIASYGADDEFILKLEDIYANPTSRTANVGIRYRHQGYDNKIAEIDGQTGVYYDNCVYDKIDWFASRTNYDDVYEQTLTAYNHGTKGIVYFIYNYYSNYADWSFVDCNASDVDYRLEAFGDAARTIRQSQGCPGVTLYRRIGPRTRMPLLDRRNYPAGSINLEAIPVGNIHKVVFGKSTYGGALWETTTVYSYPFTTTYTLNAGETVILRAQAVDTDGQKSVYAANMIYVVDPAQLQCGDYESALIPGDLNKDCRVDMGDVADFVASWVDCDDPNRPECRTWDQWHQFYCGQIGSGFPGMAADLEGDCDVDLIDFALFAGNWLDCDDPQGCP
ncbi:MAG: hypothetical protein ABIG61_00675 [Planctomycetota bacterium]